MNRRRFEWVRKENKTSVENLYDLLDATIAERDIANCRYNIVMNKLAEITAYKSRQDDGRDIS